jgi:hypothetical protein
MINECITASNGAECTWKDPDPLLETTQENWHELLSKLATLNVGTQIIKDFIIRIVGQTTQEI